MATASRAPLEGGPPSSGPALARGAAGVRLAELFEANGRTVYGLCRVLLRDRTEAEDAAQQTFLSAYEALLAGTEPREPAAWLAAIARNECRRRLLRAGRQRPLVLVEELERSGDLERDAGERADVAALCAALAELPSDQRHAVLLREFYGLSYDEIAIALGTTVPAVESLLHRTRRRLQAVLRPQRAAAGAIGLPLALHASLARAVPGFSASGGGAPGIASSLVAKALTAPLGAKVAAALALAAVGASLVVAPRSLSPTRTAAVQRPGAAGAMEAVSAGHDESKLASPAGGAAATAPRPAKGSGSHAPAHERRLRRDDAGAPVASTSSADEPEPSEPQPTSPPPSQSEDGDAQGGDVDSPTADARAEGDSSDEGASTDAASVGDAAEGSALDGTSAVQGPADGQ